MTFYSHPASVLSSTSGDLGKHKSPPKHCHPERASPRRPSRKPALSVVEGDLRLLLNIQTWESTIRSQPMSLRISKLDSLTRSSWCEIEARTAGPSTPSVRRGGRTPLRMTGDRLGALLSQVFRRGGQTLRLHSGQALGHPLSCSTHHRPNLGHPADAHLSLLRNLHPSDRISLDVPPAAGT